MKTTFTWAIPNKTILVLPKKFISSIHLIQLYDVVHCIYEVKLHTLYIQRYFINTMYNIAHLNEVNRAFVLTYCVH